MDSQVSKKLSTMLPLDVFNGLTQFAKQYALTGMGKFDYGVAIRILLLKSEYADRIYSLDKRIDELDYKEEPKINEIPKGMYQVKTLSDLKLNRMEVEDGKI
jgi:hypothetical protein